MKACVVLLFLAACGSKHDGPSCADRVAAMSGHLSSPRPVEEIRKTASPVLRADLDAVMAAGDDGHRATRAAKRLEPDAAACPPLAAVFGEVASIEDKSSHLRKRVPEALSVCRCKASPEHVGGLLEAILSDWK
jgi:hypothetical protein